MVQEEVINVVLAGGLTPSKTTFTQLRDAIKGIIAASSGVAYGEDSGTANAYAVTLTPALADHIEGMPILVLIANTNTGASTLDPGPGATQIVGPDGGALNAGDLLAGDIAMFVFDGTRYRTERVTASTSRVGQVQLASSAEAITGTDAKKSLTAKALTDVLDTYVATTSAAGFVEFATNAETQAGTDATRGVTPFGLASLTATTTRAGLVELATTGETVAGTSAVLGTSPAGVAAAIAAIPDATTSVSGLVEFATNVETQTGTDATRGVTPAGLASLTATAFRAGLIQLATTAETVAGLSTVLAATPAGVVAAIPSFATATQVNNGASLTTIVAPGTMAQFPGVCPCFCTFGYIDGSMVLLDSFNLFGSHPTLARTAAGKYTITFPGASFSATYGQASGTASGTPVTGAINAIINRGSGVNVTFAEDVTSAQVIIFGTQR
jgi:hypothetical protein